MSHVRKKIGQEQQEKRKFIQRFFKKCYCLWLKRQLNLISRQYICRFKNKGKIIGDADILIASIVINNGGILVSNNQKHYENIASLNLENWLQ